MPTEIYKEYAKLRSIPDSTVIMHIMHSWIWNSSPDYGTDKISLLLGKNDALDLLNLPAFRPPGLHEDDEGFLEYTAKEIAIEMIWNMSDTDAAKFFKGLEEPLTSRVFHYLMCLRGIYPPPKEDIK